MSKEDVQQLKQLIIAEVTQLCQTHLQKHCQTELSIEGLLGITFDHTSIFLVNISQTTCISKELNKEASSGTQDSLAEPLAIASNSRPSENTAKRPHESILKSAAYSPCEQSSNNTPNTPHRSKRKRSLNNENQLQLPSMCSSHKSCGPPNRGSGSETGEQWTVTVKEEVVHLSGDTEEATRPCDTDTPSTLVPLVIQPIATSSSLEEHFSVCRSGDLADQTQPKISKRASDSEESEDVLSMQIAYSHGGDKTHRPDMAKARKTHTHPSGHCLKQETRTCSDSREIDHGDYGPTRGNIPVSGTGSTSNNARRSREGPAIGYECTVCGSVYRQQWACTRHQQLEHNGDAFFREITLYD